MLWSEFVWGVDVMVCDGDVGVMCVRNEGECEGECEKENEVLMLVLCGVCDEDLDVK